jgi:hypothetical protein
VDVGRLGLAEEKQPSANKQEDARNDGVAAPKRKTCHLVEQMDNHQDEQEPA